MKIVRHKGIITATGTRCTVVFRELPEEPTTCLVYEADSLPDYFRDALDSVVNKEGQSTRDLYEVLHRHHFPSGENMLTALHDYKLLHPKSTSEVTMLPTSESKISLEKLNEQLRELDSPVETNTNNIQKKFNPYEESAEQLDTEEAVGITHRLLQEADSLEGESVRKREQAYKLRPELRPEEVTPLVTDLVAGDIDPTEAVRLMEELNAMYGPVDSDTELTVELSGISQRKAGELVKEAWKKVNPTKVKNK